MSAGNLFDSASGLKPASAFVLISIVLLVVAGRVVALVATKEVDPPAAPQTESDKAPAYSIHDRDGRPLATFVQRLDLVLSPNAMWQAHTPDSIARRVSEALGGSPTPALVLEAFLPDAKHGVVVAEDPLTHRALHLSFEAAQRVDAFARTARTPRTTSSREAKSIDGVWLEEQPDRTWILCWSPVVTLSEEMRTRHMPERRHNPLAWTRFLADGLAWCLLGDPALQPGPGTDEIELGRQRDWVWSSLMPSTWDVALRGFDARFGPALAALLDKERVAQHQMRIERGRTRDYPGGSAELLGFWGHVERDQAECSALAELGFEAPAVRDAAARERALATLSPLDLQGWRARVRELIGEPLPLAGLERACDRLLKDGAWSELERRPATFTYRVSRPVGELARSYFLGASEASDAPRVVTTLDALLQRHVGQVLDGVMRTYSPAITMAVAIDVETADVLAIDARSSYPLEGWAPLFHQYPPGSTFKVPVMATALESGRVRPGDVFDVGDGRGFNYLGRTIHEAENSRTGRLTAAECLAHSVNAGLVQIGAQIPPEYFSQRLHALHYGEAPQAGLGWERAGSIPRLPWNKKYEQASVSYGYQTQVTLWQHAAALAAIVRGGVWKPLRVLDAVEQDDWARTLPSADGERVFSARTCEEVRAMMALGARDGTGARVASPELLPGFEVGTKTGTAEKVPGEVCLHHELADQARHHREGTRCSRACRNGQKALAKPHSRACLTLSMCIFGRRAGDDREVMVLVVVDEPLHKARFGSDTAGPPAVAILREALGTTVFGQPESEPWIEGFARAPAGDPAAQEQPWAEVAQ